MTEQRESAEQDGLFGADEQFKDNWNEWKGMPEFVQEDLQPFQTILVHFATPEDLTAFEALVDQRIQRTSKRTAAIWFPKVAVGSYANKRYRTADEP